MDIADTICSGCRHDYLEYYPVAEKYGGNPFGHSCQRDIGEKCPRAHAWKDYYSKKEQPDSANRIRLPWEHPK